MITLTIKPNSLVAHGATSKARLQNRKKARLAVPDQSGLAQVSGIKSCGRFILTKSATKTDSAKEFEYQEPLTPKARKGLLKNGTIILNLPRDLVIVALEEL